MWHRHRWIVVSREEKPSDFEANNVSSVSWAPRDILRRWQIVHYRCEKCGVEKVVRV